MKTAIKISLAASFVFFGLLVAFYLCDKPYFSMSNLNEPKYLFFDDFSSYKDGSDGSPVWQSQKTWDKRCDWQITDGGEISQMWVGEPGDDCVILAGENDWADYVLTARVKIVGNSEDSGANIKIRAQDEHDYYYVMILPYWDSVILKKHKGEGIDEYIAPDYDEIKIGTGIWYVLEAQAKGDVISVWITDPDGVRRKTHEIQDKSFAKGKIGLATDSGEAYFDFVKVSAVE